MVFGCPSPTPKSPDEVHRLRLVALAHNHLAIRGEEAALGHSGTPKTTHFDHDYNKETARLGGTVFMDKSSWVNVDVRLMLVGA